MAGSSFQFVMPELRPDGLARMLAEHVPTLSQDMPVQCNECLNGSWPCDAAILMAHLLDHRGHAVWGPGVDLDQGALDRGNIGTQPSAGQSRRPSSIERERTLMDQCERKFTMMCEDCPHNVTDGDCVVFRCQAVARHHGRHVYMDDTYSVSWDRSRGEDEG